MTQEKLMKDRMIRAIVLFGITLIALLVFIGLDIDETHRVQEQYRTQFRTYLVQTSESISSYLDNEGDLPLRYRRILSDFSSANSFGFLLESLTEDQKRSINELQACLMKYPEQMQDKKRLEAMKTAVDDMGNNLDKGFTEAGAVVDSVDKKGH